MQRQSCCAIEAYMRLWGPARRTVSPQPANGYFVRDILRLKHTLVGAEKKPEKMILQNPNLRSGEGNWSGTSGDHNQGTTAQAEQLEAICHLQTHHRQLPSQRGPDERRCVVRVWWSAVKEGR